MELIKQGIYAADSREILDISQEGEGLNYNRQISEAGLRMLDPKGVHIIRVFMIHEHAMGKRVDPHYRCQVMLKHRGSMEPQAVWMDIPMHFFPEKVEALIPEHEPPLDRAS